MRTNCISIIIARDTGLINLLPKSIHIEEINFNGLLEKYGPEGLFAIADKLKEIAREDCEKAMREL